MRKIYLRISVPNKKPKKYMSANIRSFSRRLLKLINWQIKGLKAYLKVSYGKQKDNFNQVKEFYNDGIYTDKENFMTAYKAFTEETFAN